MLASNSKIPMFLSLPSWGVMLIGLQCLYLIFELSFKARLVDSVVVADPDYFEYLSHVGRLLSGAGCTLLVFSLLRKWKTNNQAARISGHLVAAFIAFPTVYYGQEAIINSLVEKSSAEQRMHAQHISLLKRGLATNVVVFKDIEFAPEDIERPEARTFINTIGFSVFFAPAYIDSVVENSDPILKQLAKHQANERLPEVYAEYLEARERVSGLSHQYNEANQNYYRQADEIEETARGIWRDAYLELQAQWEEKDRGNQGDSLREGFDRLYDRLELYFIARARCDGFGQKACLQHVNQEYNEQVKSSFGQQVAPEYWCKPVQTRETHVMQGGQFVEKQLGGGYDCSARHRTYIRDQFLKLQGVSSFQYATFKDFVASAEVAAEVRSQLAEKDIRMPANYRLRDHESFINGVESELIRQLKQRFIDQAKSRFDAAIPPELGTEAFIAHPGVQLPLKEALGVESRTTPVPLNLSEKAFRDTILVARIEQSLAAERARLMVKTAYYADGEPYAEDGKLYVRSVLIPPVAMGLSLFFGLLNLVSLLAISFNKFGMGHRAAATGRYVLLAIIIVLPIAFSSQIAQTAPFQRIVEETQESLGWGRYLVVWLTSLQPAIYPIGDAFADTLGLFDSQGVDQP
ncbi:hypothetical protein KG088_17740 [Halomonas sp. TRM85114]|uniref:hypothetical protein n=1 Tax=Halomonas jincaotanensis TaxID=2810616 RepID=UPI001BD55ADA|nr:hypothetical protein [Halomonas jincaotanensis]MBS9405450.1 hypothetical protein [Halomonas jincaotanensis]